MTSNYPGFDVSEILSLAADIVDKGGKHSFDYVQSVMIPVARDEYRTNGDSFIHVFGAGYYLTTVLNCAHRIADELETKGYVVP